MRCIAVNDGCWVVWSNCQSKEPGALLQISDPPQFCHY